MNEDINSITFILKNNINKEETLLMKMLKLLKF